MHKRWGRIAMMRTIFAAALAVTLAACATKEEAAAPAAPPPERALTQIKGDVYRYQNNQHFGVVLVTDEGIVVADPINREAAEWLKGELAQRFPGKPVKYVLYSHHHFDHVAGGGAFPEARVIAHADVRKNLAPPAADAPVSGFLAAVDANKDGKLQKAEVEGNPFLGPMFDTLDGNKDGEATALEIHTGFYSDVRAPDGTFKSDYTLTLGGQSVRMIHVGGGHASDMVYMMFPGDVLFVVDVINIKRLPFGMLADYDFDESMALIDKAAALKPALITPGHGAVGTVEDLGDVKQYFTDIFDGVRAGIAEGKSLEEIQASLTLDKYKDWGNYEAFRAQNIAGVYAKLKAGG
jgi:glyoxylase-like metal-dependent hydrolase (beta-lactamase superfamily II)